MPNCKNHKDYAIILHYTKIIMNTVTMHAMREATPDS